SDRDAVAHLGGVDGEQFGGEAGGGGLAGGGRADEGSEEGEADRGADGGWDVDVVGHRGGDPTQDRRQHRIGGDEAGPGGLVDVGEPRAGVPDDLGQPQPLRLFLGALGRLGGRGRHGCRRGGDVGERVGWGGVALEVPCFAGGL